MIGVIGALDVEVALLLKQMVIEKIVKRSGVTFFRGKLLGMPVVVCVSGIGKVNAAKTAQTLIERFKSKAIIFTGVAGSIEPTLRIGDSVISTKTEQHDVDFKALGFPLGVIPDLKTSVFPANPFLIRLAQRAARSIPQVRVRLGKILTGDQFIASQIQARRLRRLFNGVCVETEGAAVGQVCFMNKVPYIVIRTMSDRADREASQDFDKFVKLAARRSQLIVLKMFRLLKKKG